MPILCPHCVHTMPILCLHYRQETFCSELTRTELCKSLRKLILAEVTHDRLKAHDSQHTTPSTRLPEVTHDSQLTTPRGDKGLPAHDSQR